MEPNEQTREGRPRISRWKLALGAAGLFLFIVGVKRSFRLDDERSVVDPGRDLATPTSPDD